VSFFTWHKKPLPLKPTANPYPSRFQGWKYRLGITFALILAIGMSVRFYKPFYERIDLELFEGTAWVQGIFLQPFYATRSFLSDTDSWMHLQENHERLQKENEKLKWQLQVLSTVAHENKGLRKLLNIPMVDQYGHHAARILVSPYDGLHHFFLIEAGRKNGLEKNQAVVVQEGIIGRVEKVGKHISRVLLLNDSNSRIPVITQISQQQAILAGDGSFFPELVYVSDSRTIQPGESVVTSGMGGIFPAGIPVGIVDEITNNHIKIRPYAPFQRIEWVHILKTRTEDFTHELNAALRAE
jgi:rod shape-determining protein MreC